MLADTRVVMGLTLGSGCVMPCHAGEQIKAQDKPQWLQVGFLAPWGGSLLLHTHAHTDRRARAHTHICLLARAHEWF